MNRLHATTRAVPAAATLVALVAGVPTALVAGVGWPLPTRVPGLAEITAAVTNQSVDPHVIVKVLAVTAWLAWAQIAWAVLAETRAAIAGRAAPVHLLPGLQRHLGRLVATVALGVTSLTARPSAAAPQPAPLHLLVDAQPDGGSTTHAAPEAEARPTPGPLPQWTVARHDTYWDIAERTLGDGHAWRRIRDLNIGRTMPDGTVIGATSDLLRPGWRLLLPADARPGDHHSTQQAAAATVEPGDSLWSIAQDELGGRLHREPTTRETTRFWADVVDLNRARIADPNRIRPGDLVDLPDPLAPAPPQPPSVTDPATPAPATGPDPTTEPAPAPRPTAPTPAAPDEVGAAHASTPAPAAPSTTPADAQDLGDERDAVPVGALGVAGGLLAAGVAAAYRRRRLRAASTMSRGLDLPAPEGFDDLRAELALTSDLDDDARLSGALADVARTGATILATVTSESTVTVVVRDPGPPPLGWAATEDPRRWTLNSTAEPFDPGGSSPVPLLVAIGHDADGEIAVNLEALGVTAIVGDDTARDDLVRALAAQIAYAPPTRPAQVIAVGRAVELAPDAARSAASWDDVADDILALARQTSATAPDGPDRMASARDDDDERIPTLVLLADAPVDDPRFDDVVALAGNGAPFAVVVAGPTAPATVVTVDADAVTVPSLGITATTQRLAGSTAAEVDDLLEAAEAASATHAPLDFGDHDAAGGEVEADVIVRVLGRVRVEGTFRTLTPKQTSVIAFIALHAPVTSDRIEDAVWPAATGSRRKRLANVLSECRAALGANALPVAAGGLYQFGPGVTSDAALFDAHVRAARHPAADPITKRAELRRALALVEGPVFQTRSSQASSYAWVDLGNLITTWELKIADTALDLIDLAGDDLDDAVWAAEQGLRALPTHVDLTEALMETLWRRGDTNAAHQVYTSHVAALEAVALDGVAESTFTLWQRLRARDTA